MSFHAFATPQISSIIPPEISPSLFKSRLASLSGRPAFQSSQTINVRRGRGATQAYQASTEAETVQARHGVPQQDVEQEATSAEHPTFSWTKQWYPVAVATALKPDKPTAVRLLGDALVLWKDGTGEWHCWRDRCPHRLAPLSEGRVEDGELMCSYHGWTFGSSGRCTSIPQADDERSLDTALSSRRACVSAHPVKVANGLVWVWADTGPEAGRESGMRQPATHPLADDPRTVWIARWFSRSLPYGADVLAENVLDPSHVGFSHHGILGNRNTVQMHRAATEKKPVATDSLCWQPPCLARYDYSTGMVMLTHAVPTDPGRSLLFFAMLQPADRAPMALKLLLPVISPPWLQFRAHFGQHNVLDGDSVFLHYQDQQLQRSDWRRKYFMPTSKDSAVASLRRWLSDYAGPIPWAASALPQPNGLSMRQLLDRYEQHTQACPDCSRALTVVTALRNVAVAACVLAATAAIGFAKQAACWHSMLRPSLLTLTLAALSMWAARTRQKFLYVPYVHAEHN